MIENRRDDFKVIKINKDEVFFYEEAMKSHPISTKVIGRPKEEAEAVIQRELLYGRYSKTQKE